MRKNFGEKSWLYPMPVLIIGTYNEDGTPNAMNAAWGGIAGHGRIMIELSNHKTTENILRAAAFTVSVGTKEHLISCDYVGIVSGRNVPDKLANTAFTTVKSDFVDAPLIRELPFALECELEEVLPGNRYVGKIANISVDESVLGPDGLPDVSKIAPISYEPVHNLYVVMGETVGKAFSDGKQLSIDSHDS